MTNPISDSFKTEEISLQENKKRAVEIIDKKGTFETIEINMSENELQLLEIFRQFTFSYDFNLLINCPIPFNEFTDEGYSILLKNNFFGVLSYCISCLRTPREIIPSLKLLLFFSKISSDISEQILGTFNDTLNYYLGNNLYELYDLSLLLCKNFSIFPSIAHSFINDDEKMKNLSIIFYRSPHIHQKQEVIKIYKNLSKFDIYRYDEFIKAVFNDEYIVEILPLTAAIKLLRYLSRRLINDERFFSQDFIENLKEALIIALKKHKKKYVKNCLKFINMRCSNTIEALKYYELGFSQIFIEIPDEFMVYVSQIYIWIFEKVPESVEDTKFLIYLINRLDKMVHNGIYQDKVAAIKLISKIVLKRSDLSHNPTVCVIALDSLDLLLTNDSEAILRILNLLIEICQLDKKCAQKKFIQSILNQDIISLLNEISYNDLISSRAQILYNIIIN